MSRLEKLIVMAVYIGQLLFVPTAMWALTRPELQLEMHRWSRPIALVLAPLSLVAVVLLFRDLYKRQFQNKSAWVVAIFLTGGVAMIPYTFIHAFRPRTQHARV
jgi:RsiW-degrading membrane proteinase PrsW (M82 family)